MALDASRPSSSRPRATDEWLMDPSAYALVHGLRRTRGTLADWRAHPGPVLRLWVLQSLAVAGLLLAATWLVAVLWPGGTRGGVIVAPPLVAGNTGDVVHILGHNLLVLAFHALACTAGFIAGSSLPLQAAHKTGLSRWVHERGQPFALAFVIGATLFSLTMQAYTIGRGVASRGGWTRRVTHAVARRPAPPCPPRARGPVPPPGRVDRGEPAR